MTVGDRPMKTRDKRPLYSQTVDEIEELIQRERLGPGDQLQSESQLSEILGVSRGTVREALRELEVRGRVVRAHGRGTTVAGVAPIVTGLSVLESLESLAARQMWRCGTEMVEIHESSADESVADALGIQLAQPVTYLFRIKTKNWQPVAIMESWLPADTISATELRAGFESSITDLVRARSDSDLNHAVAQVSAVAADEVQANALKVPVASPLVVLLETCYDGQRRPILHSRNYFLPESVRLEILRRPG